MTMATSSGNIILINYNVENTLSGRCDGQVWSVDVSGATNTRPPYTISWSGSSNGYTASTFDIINLCEGWYEATVTDSRGNTGSTQLQISGFTVPTIVGSLTNDDCVLDTNKLGQISITNSITETSSFRYELVKNGSVVSTHYGTTADTTHIFSSITNGNYSVSVIEDRPMNTNIAPDNSGCTPYNYNDGNNGMSTAGWDLNRLSATTIGDVYGSTSWTPYIPNAPYDMPFTAGWGPAPATGMQFYDTGLGLDGKVYSNNPYVWFYTGTTDSRMTDTNTDWYLGESAIDMTEGGNLGPVTLAATVANIGKFYYNTIIQKYLYWWPGQGASFAWLTLDPRQDYGIYGNPVAVSGLTGTTYGVTIEDVSSSDYSVASGGTVAVATGIVLEGGSSQLYATSGNNAAIVGKQSLCSYYNYTWETTFRSSASDNDSIAISLASFRDEAGKYGPTGVTHTLDLVFNGNRGTTTITNNIGSDAYGFHRYKTPNFRNCNGGCGSSETTNYGLTTVLSNTPSKTPFTSGTNWSDMGATRVKINRYGNFGEFFTINFTDTMANSSGGAVTKGNGDANPYNATYTIDFNLLDKSTWVGDNSSVPYWVDNYALCKYLGSKRIGFWSSSQDDSRFYHMQFSGGSFNEYLEGPICGVNDGPTNTIGITASTGTTVNIINTKRKPKYNTIQKGVPQVRPTVNVSLQQMPNPTLTINGLSRATTNVTTQRGGKPILDVYNLGNDKGKNIQFYFGGNNQDMSFENLYPKFRVYPYIFETEEVAPLADYEAIFDTMPAYMDKNIKSVVYSAETFMPLSGLSTSTSWEFIIRPSYLFKDKKSTNDTWLDTAQYPTSTNIDADKDFYMVVVQTPPTPQLYLDSFDVPVVGSPVLRIENYVLLSGSGDIPDTTATTYATSTFYYTLQSPVASRPIVTVNGITLKEGISGTTTPTGYEFGGGASNDYGDYIFYENSRGVRFHPETVQVGDSLQFMYDANGGGYTQFIEIPETVTTIKTETIYNENDYYHINLDRQSLGAIGLAINGVTQQENKDYVKSGDKSVQLLNEVNTYNSGDTIVLFYKTIYQVISTPVTKEPVIPISYIKDNNLVEEVIVRLFDSLGNKVQELIEKIDINTVGNVSRDFTLLPPTPDTYYYYVLVRRYYPLIGGQTITTESQTDTVNFVMDRSVFYTTRSY
jgi:hypothetical protein|tara:strand:- start:8413 stop:11934 length:3522 start_codon:yes stop_codon:yes gene_type:complete